MPVDITPALLGPLLAHEANRVFTKKGVLAKSISGFGSE